MVNRVRKCETREEERQMDVEQRRYDVLVLRTFVFLKEEVIFFMVMIKPCAARSPLGCLLNSRVARNRIRSINCNTLQTQHPAQENTYDDQQQSRSHGDVHNFGSFLLRDFSSANTHGIKIYRITLHAPTVSYCGRITHSIAAIYLTSTYYLV